MPKNITKKVETWVVEPRDDGSHDDGAEKKTKRSRFEKRNPKINSATKGKSVTLQKVLQNLSKQNLTDLEIDEICKFISEFARHLCWVRSSLIQQRPHGPEISNAENDIDKLLAKFDLACVKSAGRSDSIRLNTCIQNVNLIKAVLGLKPTEITREEKEKEKGRKFKRGCGKQAAGTVGRETGVKVVEEAESSSETPNNWDSSNSDNDAAHSANLSSDSDEADEAI